MTSNFLTSFARGDVALSISLTAVISLLSIITIPLVAVFAYGHFIGEQAMQNITVADTAISVFLIVTVPVTIGLLVRLFASGPKQRTAIAIECGLQNGTLAIAIAVLLFGGGLATVPTATYSLTMFVTALILVALLRRTRGA